MGFATDLGYIPPNVKEQLRALDLLLLESNHDLEMLRDGPYPWSVKQRVLSRVGHLSNDATAEFLSTAYDGHAAYVILAHLSENNNLPELARVAAERAPPWPGKPAGQPPVTSGATPATFGYPFLAKKHRINAGYGLGSVEKSRKLTPGNESGKLVFSGLRASVTRESASN
ncbi:MAG: hypothetical protein WDM87_00110 [Terracidiphilus sp.]